MTAQLNSYNATNLRLSNKNIMMCLQSFFGGKNKLTEALGKSDLEVHEINKEVKLMKKEVLEVKELTKKIQESGTAPIKGGCMQAPLIPAFPPPNARGSQGTGYQGQGRQAAGYPGQGRQVGYPNQVGYPSQGSQVNGYQGGNMVYQQHPGNYGPANTSGHQNIPSPALAFPPNYALPPTNAFPPTHAPTPGPLPPLRNGQHQGQGF